MTDPSATDAPVSKWQAALDALKAKKAGRFRRLAEGKTRIRLVPFPGSADETFYVEATKWFNKKARQVYLVNAVILSSEKYPVKDEDKTKVFPLVFPPKVMESVFTLLAEGYDLLTGEGFGITIVRSGKTLDTSYNVMPSQKKARLDIEGLTWYEGYEDPAKLALAYEENTKAFTKGNSKGGEDSADEDLADGGDKEEW